MLRCFHTKRLILIFKGNQLPLKWCIENVSFVSWSNLDVSQFPKELQAGTTTLKEELKREGNENLLIKIFLEEFEKISELFNHKGYEDILKEWRKRSYSIGKIVEVREPFNRYYDGYVVGIDKEGALIVEKIDGTLKKVISGECIIKN